MRLLVLLAAGMLSITIAPAASADAAEVFTVYMAPKTAGGSDTNDGRAPQTGVLTFVRVEQILREANPRTDVMVRIKQGVFYTNPHVWQFYVPGHTVTFAPVDWQPGTGAPGGRPIFRNPGENGGPFLPGSWLHAKLPSDPAHPLYRGGDMGLRFYYLTVDCYGSAGISLDGDTGRDVRDETYNPPLRQPGSLGHNGNVVFGMVFNRIGSQCAKGTGEGYAAMILTNSRNNRFENNHFTRFEDEGASRVHGLYITHFSSGNRILRNRFFEVSGQGVKLRDRSNSNEFTGNTFEKSGWYAYYYEQFCDAACLGGSGAGKARECASNANRFTNNDLVSDAWGGRTKEYQLDPPGQTHAGEAGCSIPAGERRVHASGNT